MICAAAGVPTQHFANRSDVAGGSTLGNIANAHVSMNTVDVGLAQLAMHSVYETAGTKDAEYMVAALKKFYETEIVMESDGSYRRLLTENLDGSKPGKGAACHTGCRRYGGWFRRKG